MPRPAPTSRRGGRRPGAGAPRGNLNALKTGARSQQFKALIIALLAVPDTRRVLMHLSRMEHRRRVLLEDAINHYARLLNLPSRERTINAVRRNQIRLHAQNPEIIKQSEAVRSAARRPARPTFRRRLVQPDRRPPACGPAPPSPSAGTRK